MFFWEIKPDKPFVIAGPCAAESFELMDEVADHLTRAANQHGFQLIFKASFDKANRSSPSSYRGPGIEQGLKWLADIGTKYNVPVTTDIHESQQVKPVAEVCDLLQIPAFLCRQTDLIVAAVESQKAISVKKGQFLSPKSTQNIVAKVESVIGEKATKRLALIERGASFGYENLVVDMRGFKVMAEQNVPIIFDITHSTQQPSSGQVTGGLRSCAPLLARAAAATGYLSGFFLEVHPNPQAAKSDAATQLNPQQADKMLSQIIPMVKDSYNQVEIDAEFIEK